MSCSASPTVAQSVSAFNQSIGVNIHVEYAAEYPTTYGSVAETESALAYLGINQVRDGLFPTNFLPEYEALAAAGVKFDFVLPVYWSPSGPHFPGVVDLSGFISELDTLATTYPGSIIAVEGPNEVNLQPAEFDGGSAPINQDELQQALFAAFGADPNLKNVPVYNLTIGSGTASDFTPYGNLSAYANYGNAHPYLPADSTPLSALEYLLPIQAGIDTSGLPVVITETGYDTDLSDGNTYSNADQTVQAKLLLDTLMDAYVQRVQKTFLYELFDESGSGWGLFTATGAPKLAATAIHNLTTVLADPNPGTGFTSGTLNYGVSLPSNANQLLLEKSNGTFDLVLWAEAQIWNEAAKTEITAKSEKVTIHFAAAQNVSVYDPMVGTSPIATYNDVTSTAVSVTDHPIIVQIVRISSH
jgi:hypothetical protein